MSSSVKSRRAARPAVVVRSTASVGAVGGDAKLDVRRGSLPCRVLTPHVQLVEKGPTGRPFVSRGRTLVAPRPRWCSV